MVVFFHSYLLHFTILNIGTQEKEKEQQRLIIKMLYIVGLGLGDEKDITIRGLEAVRKCDKVYMEAYTSLLSFGLSSDGLSTLVPLSLSLFISQYSKSYAMFGLME